MDLMDKYGEASGWDFDALAKSGSKLGKQFRRDMYDYKSRGKNLLEVSNLVNTMIEEETTDPEKYIPPEIRKMMYDIRGAELDLDAYMRGEGIGDEKMKGITNMLRSYESFTPHMNNQLTQMQKMGMEQQLIAPGTDFNDMNFAANAETAIAESGDLNWDEYRKAVMKFYDVDKARTIVEGIYDQNSLWEGKSKEEREEIIDASTRTFIAHLPRQIDITQKFVDTKALGWAGYNLRKMDFERQGEWRAQEWESYYTEVNNEAEELEPGAIEAMNKVSTPEAKKAALKQYLSDNNKNPVELGGVVMAEMPTYGNQVVGIKISEGSTLVGSDGKIKTIKDEIAYLAKNPTKDNIEKAGELNQILKSQTARHQVNFRGQGYSQYNSGTGQWQPVETTNNATTENSKNVAYRAGKVGYGTGETKTVDGKTKEVGATSSYTFVQVNPIGTHADQRALSDDEKQGQEKATSAYKSNSGIVVGKYQGSGRSSNY
jgi:hypothetical protein